MEDIKLHKGLSIFLIAVGIVVALSGIVVIALMSKYLVGFAMIIVGLVFSYGIYRSLQEKEELYLADMHK